MTYEEELMKPDHVPGEYTEHEHYVCCQNFAPQGTKLVLMADTLFDALGVSYFEWGEPDRNGVYSPVLYRTTEGAPRE